METLPATMNASRSLEGMLDGVAYPQDRKSTRLNSSHSQISYAVFCLKKKKHNILVELLEEYKQGKHQVTLHRLARQVSYGYTRTSLYAPHCHFSSSLVMYHRYSTAES